MNFSLSLNPNFNPTISQNYYNYDKPRPILDNNKFLVKEKYNYLYNQNKRINDYYLELNNVSKKQDNQKKKLENIKQQINFLEENNKYLNEISNKIKDYKKLNVEYEEKMKKYAEQFKNGNNTMEEIIDFRKNLIAKKAIKQRINFLERNNKYRNEMQYLKELKEKYEEELSFSDNIRALEEQGKKYLEEQKKEIQNALKTLKMKNKCNNNKRNFNIHQVYLPPIKHANNNIAQWQNKEIYVSDSGKWV